MTDVIFEAVALGVDSVISGSIVSMIVLVLTLSSKLNAYASMQETYAQSITYYRQYSKYNNTDIVSADALSALFYYDSNIDIFIVDFNTDSTEETARGLWLYCKINDKLVTYRAEITKDEANSCYIVDYGAANTVFAFGNESDMVADIYERYLSGSLTPYTLEEGVYLSHADVSNQVKAGTIFHAYLLEDLQNTPEGLYNGGTVTGILMLRK